MRSCELKHSITIEEPSETQDSTGQPVPTWATFASTRAKIDTTIEFGRSREVFAGASIDPAAYVIFTIRYLSGLTEKMRIAWAGDYYNILALADVDARHAYWQIRAERGLVDG